MQTSCHQTPTTGEWVGTFAKALGRYWLTAAAVFAVTSAFGCLTGAL